MSEPAKVRILITSCMNPHFWYTHMIGQVLLVDIRIQEGRQIFIYDINTGARGYIKSEDAMIIGDE